MELWGRSGDLCEPLSRQNPLTCSSCICSLSFPCFLSQHVSPDLPVMDVCSAAVSFDIFPPLAADRPKTIANMGLLNGFSSVFLLSLCPSPHPLISTTPFSTSLSLSLLFFIVPQQVFTRRCTRRSLNWTQTHQG